MAQWSCWPPISAPARSCDNADLPLGMLTSLVGGPFFFWLLRRTRLPSGRVGVMGSMIDRTRSLFGRATDVPARTERGAVTMRATGINVERGGRTVLDGVDLTVRSGEVLALVGPNGAGKSTLLAALSGDQAVAAGTVELDGKPLGDWTPSDMSRRRAVLPQQHTVGFSFTARQVVTMGRAPWQRTGRDTDDDKVIDECMDICDVRQPRGPAVQRPLGRRACARRTRPCARAGHRDRPARRAHRGPRPRVTRSP